MAGPAGDNKQDSCGITTSYTVGTHLNATRKCATIPLEPSKTARIAKTEFNPRTGRAQTEAKRKTTTMAA